MFNLSDTCKKLIRNTIVCAVTFYILGMIATYFGFFTDSYFHFTVGMLFGSVFTVLKIMLLEKAVQKAVNMSPQDSSNYMRLNYMNRYFLTAIVVVIAIFVNHIGLIGTLLGLFTMTPATFITGKLEKDKKNN